MSGDFVALVVDAHVAYGARLCSMDRPRSRRRDPIARRWLARERPDHGAPQPRLLDRVREALHTATTAGGPRRRTSGGSAATSCFTAGGHPREMGADEVTRFLPTLLRDAPPRIRLRHQDGPDAARAPRRADDDDLHPRPESGTRGRAVAGGPARRDGGGRLLEGNRAPRPGVLHGRPSRAIATHAEMTAGENRREVGCLSRMSGLLLRGRASSGWRRYADLFKYRWASSSRALMTSTCGR